MNYLLLLGAGFSRNWGGWLANEAFEYLLGCQEIVQSERLKALLWKHKLFGGFESALAELQSSRAQESQQRQFDNPYCSQIKEDFDKLQSALEHMFQDMNKAFLELNDFEFQPGIDFRVTRFLMKFDAIFTLNQDLLLEKCYIEKGMWHLSEGKWNGGKPPGIIQSNYYAAGSQTPVMKWISETSDKFKVENGQQPYFKLHGSSEWRDGSDQEMLVIGGNKEQAIVSHPILKWYYEEFLSRLSKHATRLMVIGYSFRDKHINRAIIEASKKRQLQIFIIDLNGADVLSKTGLTNTRINNTYTPNELEPIIIGASRRSMREIFGPDGNVEHSKVMRFFG